MARTGPMSYSREERCQRSKLRDLDRPLFLSLLRKFRFADRCFAFSASFLDSRIASASFALARPLNSRSSPVSAILRERSLSLASHSDAPRLYTENRELSPESKCLSVTLVGCIVGDWHQAEKTLTAAKSARFVFAQPATRSFSRLNALFLEVT